MSEDVQLYAGTSVIKEASVAILKFAQALCQNSDRALPISVHHMYLMNNLRLTRTTTDL